MTAARIPLRPDRGFTLLETLVALVVVSVVLLGGLGAYLEVRTANELLLLQRQVSRLLEASLEELRGGSLPLTAGPLAASWQPRVGRHAVPTQLRLDALPPPRPNLSHVRVSATFTWRHRSFRRSVETLLYRPVAEPCEPPS